MRPSSPGRAAATVAIAVGLVALGLISLAYRDLLLQWQPAPKGAPWRMPVACVSGAILLVAGAALLVPRFRAFGAVLGCAWVATWTVALHGPLVVASKGNIAALLGLAESGAIATGLALIAVRADRTGVRRALTVLFGACAIVFGISHFVYADFTAGMVPGWLPMHRALAYATGAVHASMGVLLVAGVAVRAAAFVEAAMMTSFVALIHVPHVLATPHDRLELTALGIAWTLASAGWVVAASSSARPRGRRA